MRESQSLMRSALAMVLLFIVLAMTTCTALAQPVASPRAFGVWLSAGGGMMRDDAQSSLSDGLGVHIQRGGAVASLRRHTVHLSRNEKLEAISLVAGRAKQTHGAVGAAISAGVSKVHERGYFDLIQGAEHDGLGAMLMGDVSLRRGGSGGIGIGLTAFANVNSFHSFTGLQVEVLAGRWR